MTWEMVENACVVELKKTDGSKGEVFRITDNGVPTYVVKWSKNVKNGIFGIPCYEGFCVKRGKKTEVQIVFHRNERRGIKLFVSALRKANIGIDEDEVEENKPNTTSSGQKSDCDDDEEKEGWSTRLGVVG